MLSVRSPDMTDKIKSPRPSATDPVTSARCPGRQDMRLADIVGAVSYALDLTEGQPPGHCLRCTWIGMRMGGVLGLSPDQLSDLYYTLLLKDAGCSSNAGRLWELYGGDDHIVKSQFKTVDSQSVMALARFVLRHAGPGEALAQRLQRVLHIAYNGSTWATELVQSRCERGADIARKFGFGVEVAEGIYALDEHRNGRGRPDGRHGAHIPLSARLALLAQVADVFHTIGGPDLARREVMKRSGTWFDPQLVALFRQLSRTSGFWRSAEDPDLDAAVKGIEPQARIIRVTEERLDTIAEALAHVIDAKSSFTYGHSQRVALYADAIGQRHGLSAPRRRWLRRGALLHDIGKLGVSNGILDKPAALNATEWAAVREHARLSEEIIGRIAVLADIAPIAGAHHERLDGHGYPKGLSAERIRPETRIITAADIYDALTARRPYRDALPRQRALAIMEEGRGRLIDGDCLDALIAALPEIGDV